MRLLLQELVMADAPPGQEGEVREVVLQKIEPVSDELEVDSLGNVIARRQGATDKTVMLVAHQDEDWALLVRHIDKKGFIRFSRLVGHRWNLLGQRVRIHGNKGKQAGVIGLTAPHLIPVKQLQEGFKPDPDMMFIDCGFRSAQEAEEAGLQIGQYITAAKHFEQLPNGRLLGNCFDNRVGLTAMIETFRRLKDATLPCNLIGVASVQEELGTRGAQTAAFTVNPDYAIALDVAPTGDHPGISFDQVPVELGKGPALLLADQFHTTSAHFNRWLSQLTEQYSIPLQPITLRAPIHFGTDAAAVELMRGGSIVTALLVPTRYFHTTHSLIDMQDLEQLVQLLQNVLTDFDQIPTIA
jgi:endoglucanase